MGSGGLNMQEEKEKLRELHAQISDMLVYL